MDFLKKKSEECKGRQKDALLSEGQTEPYVKIVAALEQALCEDSATALSKPLRIQLQADRERRMTGKKKEVVVLLRLLSMLSLLPSAGSRMIELLPATVTSTI